MFIFTQSPLSASSYSLHVLEEFHSHVVDFFILQYICFLSLMALSKCGTWLKLTSSGTVIEPPLPPESKHKNATVGLIHTLASYICFLYPNMRPTTSASPSPSMFPEKEIIPCPSHQSIPSRPPRGEKRSGISSNVSLHPIYGFLYPNTRPATSASPIPIDPPMFPKKETSSKAICANPSIPAPPEAKKALE